ncbi:MAG: glycosyltransferase family 2 protein [Defluviitaleaceae bacterium]|nr:glycosyltransferase family 2 protein [Defluviitaleaceae bacterium]
MPDKEKLYIRYRKDSTSIDRNEVKKLDRPFTLLGKLASLLFMVLCVFAIWRFTLRADEWYLLGGLMFVYLLIKQVCALWYRPSKRELTKDYKVSVIITCFNENPTSVVQIFENILALDYPVHEILFLDDGSKDTLAFDVAKSFAKDHLVEAPNFQLVRFGVNRGKRAVLSDGLYMAEGDYVFLVDSDSEILPNALTELLRPFEDGKTTSSVGNIGILNKEENFLTKLQSITYFGSFQLGRAAQSVTGDVVVCSGAFSLHKKDFILENLDELHEDNMFGITVSAGDDRAITTFSKKSGGKTRYQSTAYCETLAPDKWKKFLSQRRRWTRSGYIGSLKSIKDMFPRQLWYLFWAFAETYFWLIATVSFIISVLNRGFHFHLMDVILYHCIISFKHNGFYMLYKPTRFLLAPIYTFIYGFTLIYTRIYAVVTLYDDGWGTRGQGRESEDTDFVIAEHVIFVPGIGELPPAACVPRKDNIVRWLPMPDADVRRAVREIHFPLPREPTRDDIKCPLPRAPTGKSGCRLRSFSPILHKTKKDGGAISHLNRNKSL